MRRNFPIPLSIRPAAGLATYLLPWPALLKFMSYTLQSLLFEAKDEDTTPSESAKPYGQLLNSRGVSGFKAELSQLQHESHLNLLPPDQPVTGVHLLGGSRPKFQSELTPMSSVHLPRSSHVPPMHSLFLPSCLPPRKKLRDLGGRYIAIARRFLLLDL